MTKENNFGYTEQGMKDLDEVCCFPSLGLQIGNLVGGGDSELLGILRPYYSIVEMGANGNKQVWGR